MVGEGLAIVPKKNMFKNGQFLANVQKFSKPVQQNMVVEGLTIAPKEICFRTDSSVSH